MEMTSTTIIVQGECQDVFEVYADKSREQTIAFCYTEEQARLIAEAGTVANETGLMPRQILEQRDALLKACKEHSTHRKLHLRSDYPNRRCEDCDDIDEAIEQAIAKAKGL